MNSSSGGLFGERSARVWTVLGGIAAVIGIAWAIFSWIQAQQSSVNHPNHPVAAGTVTPSTSDTGSQTDDGVWVAQLASVPIGSSAPQLQQALSEVQREVPQAKVLDSSDYESLNPGYWMIYYAGPFSNGNQALVYCADHGRVTRNQCVGRFLSHKIADMIYVCFPPSGSDPSGCYRS